LARTYRRRARGSTWLTCLSSERRARHGDLHERAEETGAA
jgi:hypothetical protein